MYAKKDILNTIICGDSLEILKKLPSDSVDLVLTSPPYWSCRVYLDEEDVNKKFEIGLEDNPQEYIDKIVEICCECLRVLKKTGVFFLNLGDVFYTQSHQGSYDRLNKEFNKIYKHRTEIRGKYKSNWLQQKGRLLIPFRIAIALQEKGILIRDVITWVKKITQYPEKTSIGTTMPYPVRDRLLSASEYIFQIVKSPKYFFNLLPVKTQLKNTSLIRYQNPIISAYSEDNPHKKSLAGMEKFRKKFLIAKKGDGRNVQLKKELLNANPTNVLMFKTENQFTTLKGHYARFPQSLAEFFLLVGSPKGGIVLDPFMGSGTTAVVAKKLGRKWIGVELNKDYIAGSLVRIKATKISSTLF